MMFWMRREVALMSCAGALALAMGCDVNQVQPQFETGSTTMDDSGEAGESEGSSSSTSSGSSGSDSSSSSSDDTGSDDGGVMGCEGDGEAMQPFGNHEFNYADGVILPNHKSQGELDSETIAFYESWKTKWLRQGCGTGRYYVYADLDNNVTVSEAHGYGMIIAAYMAGHDPQAREIFDGMFRYFEDHPSDGDARLLAWFQDTSCNSANGPTSAADGDLDIAYALLLADKQWGSNGDINYAAEAATLMTAIWQSESEPGFMHMGDWVGPGQYFDATRSSDFMPQHFASFEAATGNGNYSGIRDTSYGIIESVQTTYAPNTGLIPDFLINVSSSPAPAGSNFLEGSYDGEYNFNACRDPWRIGVDYVVNGDSRARTIVERMTNWMRSNTGDSAAGIRSGYWMDGDQLPNRDYIHLAYMAPFGVAAMADASHQNWLNQIWNQVVTYEGNDTYYGDTIAMIDLIIMSGNYWTPENAPC